MNSVFQAASFENEDLENEDLEGIAIVGMDGRFPGANSVAAFWENLCNGIESISELSDAELVAADVSLETRQDSHYVKAASVLSDIEGFDAAFFGISPREAKSMDPQHRLLLECAWGAIEDAGYDTENTDGRVGVYTGTSLSTYLHHNLLPNAEFLKLAGDLQIEMGNDKDFVPTRISYKLNLKGPSVAVSTACSSSLVAVHLACQGLLDQECDMAIAGGATLQVPHQQGYWYQPDGIASPDGHCRPFDAQAKGTVFGNGIGVVVLKRLEDAIADNDNIYAVIKGSAINNDGALKVGYTAPSVDGQAEAIADAHAIADIDPNTITYVEAHGTGTAIGDPIEVSALTQAFYEADDDERDHRTQFCALGSVKGNIGHLNRAAGIVGLIKTALAIKHQQLPPTLHFQQPNPLIDFANSPFYVNDKLRAWQPEGMPRRAGVSSFGIGGTNAHAVLEEAPVQAAVSKEASESDGEEVRSPQLFVLSAKTNTALETASQNLLAHLKQQPELQSAELQFANLADIAFTLQIGRQSFSHRRALVASTKEQLIEALSSSLETNQSASHQSANKQSTNNSDNPSVVFMFSGQGSQYVNMARGLYECESIFRDTVDHCTEILASVHDLDLREILYPATEQAHASAEKLSQTAVTQPALFVIEYALAQLLMDRGVTPQAMIGHSIGEYVAACLAGVFSLEDALKLVVLRGQMMQALPTGAMLAIFLPQSEIEALLPADITLATSNSPRVSSVSGPTESIDALREALERRGIEYRSLKTSHAFHSAMMEPILVEFSQVVSQLKLSEPSIPYVSNVTGTWITAAEATSADYWAQHLRQTVRFSEGVALLLQDPGRIFVEVGPGVSLRSLTKQQPATKDRILLTTTRHPKEENLDSAVFLESLGQLWTAGIAIAWEQCHLNASRRRVSLPTYPFEHQRFWVEPSATKSTESMAAVSDTSFQLNSLLTRKDISAAEKAVLEKLLNRVDLERGGSDAEDNIADWLYQISWQKQEQNQLPEKTESGSWILLGNKDGAAGQLVQQLAQQLEAQNQRCIFVSVGDRYPNFTGNRYRRLADSSYEIDPREAAHFEQLISDVASDVALPLKGIVHLWGWETLAVDAQLSDEMSAEHLMREQTVTALSAVNAMNALSAFEPNSELKTGPKLWILTKQAVATSAGDRITGLSQAALWGLGKSMALEQPALWGGLIDLDEEVPASLAADLLGLYQETQLAYRQGQRWAARLTRREERITESQHSDSLEISGDRTYLITGGLGSIGLQVADWLVSKGARNLVLVGRNEPSDRAAQAIEQLSAKNVAVQIAQADIANGETITDLFHDLSIAIESATAPLKGIIHTAGMADHTPLTAITEETLDTVCRAKVQGTWNLHQLSASLDLDFFVCFSSIASVWGAKGQAAYAAANHFLDSFAAFRQASGSPTITLNWGPWAQSTMATPEIQRQLKRMGIVSLPTTAALKALEQALEHALESLQVPQHSQPAQVTIADIDWDTFKPIYNNFDSNRGEQPFLAQILTDLPLSRRASADTAAVNTQSLLASTSGPKLTSDFVSENPLERLMAAPETEKLAILLPYLQGQIARTLSISPNKLDVSQALNYLGLDSLMAIELKNLIKTQFHVEISTTKFMSGLSVSRLANELLDQLQPQLPQATAAASSLDPPPTDNPQQLLENLDALTDDEVDALIKAMS